MNYLLGIMLVLLLCLPECLHLVEREISEGLARIDSCLLHTAETRDEFLVGTLERRLGIYAIESAGVDQRKEQIAKFALQKIVILVGSASIVQTMVENNRLTKRYTGLTYMLENFEGLT